MSAVFTYLFNHVAHLLPPTRCYPLKAYLLRICGYHAAPSCRIVSSVRVWGAIDLRIGEDTFIGHECLISGGECVIDIGSHVAIAPRVTIVSGTHCIDMNGQSAAGVGESRDIRIGDGAWIGACSTILGGVTVGAMAIIAAGSVVTKAVPPYCMAAGIPCRPTKYWNRESHRWERALDAMEVQR